MLSLTLLFYVIPSTIYAKVANAIETNENAYDNTVIVTDSSSGADDITTENVLDGILYEATELREENVKHFRLSDGRYVAAQYDFPVHVLDENGTWQDIDNSLSDYGSEFSNESARIKFAKKITGNSELFALHDGNTKISLSLIGATKGTVGAVTNNSDADTDTELQKMMNLEKISASVIYKDILKGVDIEYVAFSKNIKESIIVKEKSNTYSYSFELKLNGIIPTLTENGDIELRDEESGTIKYVIPAPIVFDANKNYAPSGIAEYDLEHKNGTKYILTVSVDTSWMNSDERAFPVTVDPTVECYGSQALNTYVDNLNPDSVNGSSTTLYVTSQRHSYWRLNSMPKIPVSANITSAEISIKTTSATDNGSCIGVYDVVSSWDATLNWNLYLSGMGALAEMPTDYRVVFIDNKVEFDVTKIVRRWYSGNENGTNMQYGFAFATIPEHSAYVEFYSDNASAKPSLTITYSDMKGVESYWPYSSHSIAGAGVGNINLANGNLTIDIPTLSTTDSLFGFTPALIYNSSLFDRKYVASSTLDTVYTEPSTGNGFKINICETLVRKKIDPNADDSQDYFVYTDADGTEHELYPTDQVNVFEDRDGLGLVLTAHFRMNTYTKGYATLTDDNNISRIFISTDDEITPSAYCLSKIKDVNENELIFVLDQEFRPTAVQVKPVGVASPIEMLELLYTSEGLICAVYNPTTKYSVVFRYSDEYNSEIVDVGENYLRTVQYCYGNNSTTANDVLSYATSGSGSNVFVYDTNEYVYDSTGRLAEIRSITSNIVLVYAWNGYRVTKVSEYANDTLGQEIAISYGIGYTQVRSTGNDELLGTEDDILTYYTLDNQGRAIGTYSCSVDGSEIYGAVYGNYDDEASKNRLKSAVSIGGSSVNHILNGDFEEINQDRSFLHWTHNDRVRIIESTPQSDEGYKSANFMPSSSTDAVLSQTVFLKAGTYTLSLTYVSRLCENYEAVVSITSTVGSGLSHTEAIALNKDSASMQKVSFSTTFYVSDVTCGGDYVEVHFTVSCESNNDNALLKIDDVMLCNTSGASNYSLVSYGDFFDISFGEGNVAASLSDYWECSDPTQTPTVWDSGNEEFGESLKVVNSSVKQRIYQSDPSNFNYHGNAYYDYVVSGFAYAPVSNMSSDSSFRIRIDVHYYQGEGLDDVVRSFYFDFIPDITSWQFISGSFSTSYIPLDEYDTNAYNRICAIDVSCEYTGQLIGYALFDNISVVRADAGNYTEYAYYTEGYSAGLLAMSGNSFYREYYNYDNYDNLITVATSRGDMIKYAYYSNTHKLKSITQARYEHDALAGLYNLTAPEGVVNTSVTNYNYDVYGNTTQIEISSSVIGETEKIVYTYTYDTEHTSVMFGALLTETDSAGVTLRYYYDPNTCTLDAVVNTGYGDGLAYNYDDVGRLVSVMPAQYVSPSSFTQITNSCTVEYTYNDENDLQSIATSSTEYAFSYDEFGNRIWVKVGTQTLADYVYAENDGKLTKIIYGNGFVTEYVYNALEMLEEIWYTDIDGTRTLVYEYAYTSSGQILSVKDNINCKKTVYTYDSHNRVAKVTVNSTDDMYNDIVTVNDFYDNGNLNTVYTEIDLYENTDYDNNYVSYIYYYNHDNSLFQYNIIGKYVLGQIELSYDNLHRLSGKEFGFESFGIDYSFEYQSFGEYASERIAVVETSVNDEPRRSVEYEYDPRGYITTVESSDDEYITYFYDDLGQLLRETNSVLGFVYTYTYDNAGNITSVKREKLEENDDGLIQMGVIGEGAEANALIPILPSLVITNTYSYTDSEWGDLLTAFNGVEITYDNIGNPLSYYNGSSYSFTWQGRRLITATKGSKNMSFSYNDEGLRVSKTVNGVTTNYYYQGTLLIAEETNSSIIVYLYDENSTPVGFMYRAVSYAEDVWDTYAFEKNIFGDIVAVYSADTGVKLISYTYGAWGATVTSYHNGGSSTTATKNPYKYRGYYYDSDLAMYYLQTRYYDPAICRFINADIPEIIGVTFYSLTDKNLFAYCDNNPVMRVDPDGEFWNWVIGTVVGATGAAIISSAQGKTGIYFWGSVANGAISGFVGGVAADILLVTGCTTIVAALTMASSSAIGSLIGNFVETKITKADWDWGKAIFDATLSAATGTLFGILHGPHDSMKEVIKQGAGKKALERGITFMHAAVKTFKREISHTCVTTIETALESFTSWFMEECAKYFIWE